MDIRLLWLGGAVVLGSLCLFMPVEVVLVLLCFYGVGLWKIYMDSLEEVS